MTTLNSQLTRGAEHPKDAGLFGRGMLYVVSSSLPLLMAALISPVLAHTLSPVEFGVLASGTTLHQIIVVFALFGIDQALVLQRTEDRDSDAARGLIAVGVTIAVLVTILFAATAHVWGAALGFGEHLGLVYVVILWTAPAVAVQMMLALLLAEDHFRRFAWVSAISAVAGQVVGLILVFTVHKDATTYSMGAVGSQFAAVAVAAVFTRPRIRGLVNWTVTKRAIKLGLPLTGAGIALFQLSAGDRLIIQVLLGTEEVGRYQTAYVMGSIVILLLSFTAGAWTPRFAALRDESARWALAAHSRNELYRLLLPVTLGTTLATPIALQVVVPPSFRPESLTIVVFLVSLSAFPFAVGCATGRLLITQRRGKIIGALTGASAAANILLNFALVPLWGIVGAAVSTLTSYMILAALQRWALPPFPAWPKVPARLAAAVVTVIIVSAASIVLPQTLGWNLIRMVFALGCLPWFVVVFKRARGLNEPIRRPRTRRRVGARPFNGGGTTIQETRVL